MSMDDNCLGGVVIVNKHKGVTSHDIVWKIRKIYKTKKVGHTGTLDPLATGVLPILVGKATKSAEYLTADNKEYMAKLKLGITTDTEDITGKVLKKSDTLPDKNQFFDACKTFVGEIEQIPPMYSAIKVNGKKLVDLAREGIEIEREARKITVYEIEPKEIDEKNGEYEIRVKCSKGTYIRTLCADLGVKLGCGATMTALERTKSGVFTIENSHTVEELEKMNDDELYSLIKPTETLFSDYEKVVLEDFYARLCKNGCEIYQKKIKTDFALGTRIRIYDKNGFFAIGEVRDYPDGAAIKSIKTFHTCS